MDAGVKKKEVSQRECFMCARALVCSAYTSRHGTHESKKKKSCENGRKGGASKRMRKPQN